MFLLSCIRFQHLLWSSIERPLLHDSHIRSYHGPTLGDNAYACICKTYKISTNDPWISINHVCTIFPHVLHLPLSHFWTILNVMLGFSIVAIMKLMWFHIVSHDVVHLITTITSWWSMVCIHTLHYIRLALISASIPIPNRFYYE